jgi:hypothetical protein
LCGSFVAAAEIFFLQYRPPADWQFLAAAVIFFSAISAKRFGLNRQDTKFAKGFC